MDNYVLQHATIDAIVIIVPLKIGTSDKLVFAVKTRTLVLLDKDSWKVTKVMKHNTGASRASPTNTNMSETSTMQFIGAS